MPAEWTLQNLERIHATEGSSPLIEALEADGACIVEDALSVDLLGDLNQDLDALVAAANPGPRHPAHDDMVRFYGTKTTRLDGIAGKSASFVDYMLDPLMHEVCDRFLRPNCADYLLNVAQLIQIGPGEQAQRLHRDEEAWPNLDADGIDLGVEALIALSEFTASNGATRIVPGSHRWEPDREPQPDEIIQAVMPAGSAVYYLGKTMHGGGANTTAATSRRGLFYGYTLGWLRTGENMFLTVPIDKVRQMPTRVQELLGYKSLGGIGVVDVGSPMARLQ